MSDLTDVWFIIQRGGSGTLSNMHGPYFNEDEAEKALFEYRYKAWNAEFYILKAQV